MTATLLLVRHAAYDRIGHFLAGRTEDVALDAAGRRQAERLAGHLACEAVTAIYASPRRRTLDTAAAIAAATDIAEVIAAEALDEVDFGAWSGKTFEELDVDPLWRQWNCRRSMVRAPGGETMLEVQQRIAAFVETQVRSGRGGKLVLVSHAEVIRAFVCHVLGLPTDAWPRFDVAPASISAVAAGPWGAKILTLNRDPCSICNDAELSADRR